MSHPIPFRNRSSFAQSVTTVAACIVLTAAASPVLAQSMDYSALQQLFGEPVTTSAIGTPQRARDVPADIEIVTADDIRRSGAIDIPGVLSHVLGVDVLRWSVLGADVSVRGYDSPMSPRLLVLIDGRQVYQDDFGRTEWSALPVELAEIRQIEIVKGPNSALFGFNAAGGVINIITFNPLYDRINTASVTLGTQGTRQLSAVAADHISNDLAIRLSAGGTQSNDFQSVRNILQVQGIDHNTSRDQFGADLHWRINANSQVELQANHSEDQRATLTPAWFTFFMHNKLDSILGRYTGETKLGIITATAYSNWSHADVVLNPFQIAVVRTHLTVATLQDVFNPTADQTVRITTEYRHSSIDEAPQAAGVVSYDIASLGGMWNWNVTPAVSLTAAVRGDLLMLGRTGGGLLNPTTSNNDWSRNIFEPSYNLGVVWHPDDPDRFRFMIARGVQLPSLIEFAGISNIFNVLGTLAGNPAINPTATQSYEVDWDRDLPSVNMQSRIGVFYQTIRDIQSLLSPYGATFTPQTGLIGISGNIANSDEVGAEFSLKGGFSENWRWGLSYTPRMVHQQFHAGAGTNVTATDYRGTTPSHVVDATLGWSRDAWEIDSFLRFQSSGSGLFLTQAGYALAPVGPSVVFDSRVGYHIGRGVTISLTGQNVLFTTPRQTAFSKVEQQLLGSVSVRF